MKAASRPAWARVIAPKLFAKLLVPMHDAESALDLRLGWESFPTFAGVLEKTGCLDRTIDLPYCLRGVVNNLCLKVFWFGETTMMRDERVSVQIPAFEI